MYVSFPKLTFIFSNILLLLLSFSLCPHFVLQNRVWVCCIFSIVLYIGLPLLTTCFLYFLLWRSFVVLSFFVFCWLTIYWLVCLSLLCSNFLRMPPNLKSIFNTRIRRKKKFVVDSKIILTIFRSFWGQKLSNNGNKNLKFEKSIARKQEMPKPYCKTSNTLQIWTNEKCWLISGSFWAMINFNRRSFLFYRAKPFIFACCK